MMNRFRKFWNGQSHYIVSLSIFNAGLARFSYVGLVYLILAVMHILCISTSIDFGARVSALGIVRAVSLAYTFVVLAVHAVFQAVLFVSHPYGHILGPKCSPKSLKWALAGFVRFDVDPVVDILFAVGPECIVLLVCGLTYLFSREERGRVSAMSTSADESENEEMDLDVYTAYSAFRTRAHESTSGRTNAGVYMGVSDSTPEPETPKSPLNESYESDERCDVGIITTSIGPDQGNTIAHPRMCDIMCGCEANTCTHTQTHKHINDSQSNVDKLVDVDVIVEGTSSETVGVNVSPSDGLRDTSERYENEAQLGEFRETESDREFEHSGDSNSDLHFYSLPSTTTTPIHHKAYVSAGTCGMPHIPSPISHTQVYAPRAYYLFLNIWDNVQMATIPILVLIAGASTPSLLNAPYFLTITLLPILWCSHKQNLIIRNSGVWKTGLFYAVLHLLILCVTQLVGANGVHTSDHIRLLNALGLLDLVGSYDEERKCPPYIMVWMTSRPDHVVMVVAVVMVCLSLTYVISVAKPHTDVHTISAFHDEDDMRTSTPTITPTATPAFLSASTSTPTFIPSHPRSMLMEIAERYNHVLCFVLCMSWGLAFHSLLTLPLFLYGLLGWVVPVKYMRGPLWWLVVYCFGLCIVSYLWDITGMGLSQDIDIGIAMQAHIFVALATQVGMTGIFAICTRYCHLWIDLEEITTLAELPGSGVTTSPRCTFNAGLETTPFLFESENESESEGERDVVRNYDSQFSECELDSSSEFDSDHEDDMGDEWVEVEQRSVQPLRERVLMNVFGIFNSISEYTYIVALALLFICSLQQINLFNAVYLVFFLIFIVSPSTAERFWTILVVYCQVIILAVYLYNFRWLEAYISSETAYLIGLTGGKNTTLLSALGWHLAILATSVLQSMFYKIALLHRSHSGRLEREEKSMENRFGMLASALLQITLAGWITVCYAVILTVTLLGNVTMFKCFLLSLVFVCIAVDHFFEDGTAAIRRFWFAIPVCSVLCLFAMYAYQFVFVHEWLESHLTVDELTQIGLVRTENLQEYLFGQIVVTWSSVLQLKMFSLTHDSVIDTSIEAKLRALKALKGVKLFRFIKRLVRYIAPIGAQWLLFGAMMQNVEALNLGTMALLMLMISNPYSHVVRCVMLVWLQGLVMVKLLYRLALVQSLFDPANMADLEWLGLHTEKRMFLALFDYVAAIVLLAMSRVASRRGLPVDALASSTGERSSYYDNHIYSHSSGLTTVHINPNAGVLNSLTDGYESIGVSHTESHTRLSSTPNAGIMNNTGIFSHGHSNSNSMSPHMPSPTLSSSSSSHTNHDRYAPISQTNGLASTQDVGLYGETQNVVSSGRPMCEPSTQVSDDHIHTSMVAYLMYLVENLFMLIGLKACYIMIAATAFLRLDFIGAIYLLCLILMLLCGEERVSRYWLSFVVLVAGCAMAQYSALVYLPPSLTEAPNAIHMPWQHWAVNLRHYFFLPPDLPKGPGTFADFTLLLMCKYQLLSFKIERPLNPASRHIRTTSATATPTTSPESALHTMYTRKYTPHSTPRILTHYNFYRNSHPASRTLERYLLHYVPLLSVMATFVAGTVQTDIPSFGYLVLCFTYFGTTKRFYALHDRVAFWRRVLVYNIAVLTLKILWQLPALLIDWSHLDTWVVTLTYVLALTKGLALNCDPTTSTLTNAWSTAPGAMLFDFILLCLVLCTLGFLKSDVAKDMDMVLKNQRHLTRKRAIFMSHNHNKRLETERAHEDTLVCNANSRVSELLSKHNGDGGMSDGVGGEAGEPQFLLFKYPSDLYDIVVDHTEVGGNSSSYSSVQGAQEHGRTVSNADTEPLLHGHDEIEAVAEIKPTLAAPSKRSTSQSTFVSASASTPTRISPSNIQNAQHGANTNKDYYQSDIAIAASASQSRLRLRHIPKWDITTLTESGVKYNDRSTGITLSTKSNADVRGDKNINCDTRRTTKELSHKNRGYGIPIDSRAAGFANAFHQILHYNWLPPPGDVVLTSPSACTPATASHTHTPVFRSMQKPLSRTNIDVSVNANRKDRRRLSASASKRVVDCLRTRTTDMGEDSNVGAKKAKLGISVVKGILMSLRKIAENLLRFNIRWLDAQSSDYSLIVGSDSYVLPTTTALDPSTAANGHIDVVNNVNISSNINVNTHNSTTTNANAGTNRRTQTYESGSTYNPVPSMSNTDNSIEMTAVQQCSRTPEIEGELWTESDKRVLAEDCIVAMDTMGHLYNPEKVLLTPTEDNHAQSVKTRRGAGASILGTGTGVGETLTLTAEFWRALLRFWMSHTEEMCYILMVINHIYYSNILSAVVPICLFCWGLWSRPWPSKTYWMTNITYVQCVIALKYLFQLEGWTFNQDQTNWFVWVIGIQKEPPGAFAANEFMDLALFVAILYHRHMSQFLGTWDNKEHTHVSNLMLTKYTSVGSSSANSNLNLNENMNVVSSNSHMHTQAQSGHKRLARAQTMSVASTANASSYSQCTLSERSHRLRSQGTDPCSCGYTPTNAGGHRSTDTTPTRFLTQHADRHTTKDSPDVGYSPNTDARRSLTPQSASTGVDLIPTNELSNDINTFTQASDNSSFSDKLLSSTHKNRQAHTFTSRPRLPTAGYPPFRVPRRSSASVVRTTSRRKSTYQQNQPRDSRRSTLRSSTPKVHQPRRPKGKKNYFMRIYHNLNRTLGLAPRDYYIVMAVADSCSFAITAFFWSSFSTNSGDIKQYVLESRMPMAFLFVLLGQFLLILIDRGIYLSKSLFAKAVLQIFVVIAIHGFAFFYLPLVLQGRSAPGLSSPVMAWYICKCVYLYASGLQLRHGYPRYLLKGWLRGLYRQIDDMMFRLYRALPFVFETISLMDWIFTPTTLTLFEWWKLEEIIYNLFINKCRYMGLGKEVRLLGQKKPVVDKIIMGWTLLIGIVLLLWCPLLIVSLSRVSSLQTPPDVVSMSFKVSSEELWQISTNADDIRPISEDQFTSLETEFNTVGYRPKDVYVVTLRPESRRLWAISPPSRVELQKVLGNNEPCPMSIEISVQKYFSGGTKRDDNVFGSFQDILKVDSPARLNLSAALAFDDTNSTKDIHLPMLLPMAVYIPGAGKISSVKPNREYFANATLRLVNGGDVYGQTNVEWWELRQTMYLQNLSPDPSRTLTPNREDINSRGVRFGMGKYSPIHVHEDGGRIELITFNEPVDSGALSAIANLGIVGIFVSIVFVAGRFLRMAVTDMQARIMYEDMLNCDVLLLLVSDIKMCRELGNLYLEEVLYRHLIEIYRDPQALKLWTDPRLTIVT
eukprot:CFRG2582T1